ncbi:MAG: DNA repair protein RecO [Candidatus Auribacterota bacterium]|nr:DNA repair protein RecO [Candidatus Auribacterota bacterium]
MAPQKTTGIILWVRDYSETSQLVNIITPDSGLLKTIAKGAHRPKNPLRGKLEILNYGAVIYYPSRTSDLHILSQFDIINSFPEALNTLEKSALYHYLAELSSSAAFGEEHSRDLFGLMLQMLGNPPGVDSITTARLWFEIHYLNKLGVLPSFDHCVHCRGPLRQGIKFSLQELGWLCSECDKGGSELVNIEPGVMAVIRYILRSRLEQVEKLKLSRNQTALLNRLLSYLVDRAVHKKLKSRRFLNHVIN